MTLTLYGSEGATDSHYMTIVLEQTVIEDYRISSSSGDRPTETLTLNFAKIEYRYRPRREDDFDRPEWDTFGIEKPD